MLIRISFYIYQYVKYETYIFKNKKKHDKSFRFAHSIIKTNAKGNFFDLKPSYQKDSFIGHMLPPYEKTAYVYNMMYLKDISIYR